MENQIGVKDTKEAIIGSLKLATLLAASFKDGVQATDIAVIFAKIQGDTVLQSALMEAYNGAGNIGAEMKDISLSEGLSMLPEVIEEFKNLINALKK